MENTSAAGENPYMILGVPFGASSDVAASAFARKAKKHRRLPDGDGVILRLTWALNQVQEVIKDPTLELSLYRVPANAAVFASEAAGLFRPRPEPMARATQPDDEANRALLAKAIAEARAAITDEYEAMFSLPAR